MVFELLVHETEKNLFEISIRNKYYILKNIKSIIQIYTIKRGIFIFTSEFFNSKVSKEVFDVKSKNVIKK